jgi:hypothetical protein
MEQSLFEKLIVAQLVKKFPAVYGTRKFIAVFFKNLLLHPTYPELPSPHPHTRFL